MKDLHGRSVNEVVCYKCKSNRKILIEEKIRQDTKEIIEKNFICAPCAGV